mgnify:CR=1 FL=1
MRALFRLALAFALLPLPFGALALPDEEKAFAALMAKQHGFDQAWVEQQLESAAHQQDIIDAMTRPAEAMPWHRYRKIFMTDERIDGGVAFMRQHRELLQRAETEGWSRGRTAAARCRRLRAHRRARAPKVRSAARAHCVAG